MARHKEILEVVTVSRWYLDKSYWVLKLMNMVYRSKKVNVWQTVKTYHIQKSKYGLMADRFDYPELRNLPYLDNLQRGQPVTPEQITIIKQYFKQTQ